MQTLDKSKAKPLKKKGNSPNIETEPKLVNPDAATVSKLEGFSAFSQVSEAVRPTTQIDYMIRLGLGDRNQLNFYRKAIQDPLGAVRNPQYREYVGKVCSVLLDMIWADNQMYTRMRTLLQQGKGLSKAAQESLEKKSLESGFEFHILLEVYLRGYDEENDPINAFGRVNSFIAGGLARELDADLIQEDQTAGEEGTLEVATNYANVTPKEKVSFARLQAAMKKRKLK